MHLKDNNPKIVGNYELVMMMLIISRKIQNKVCLNPINPARIPTVVIAELSMT